MSIAARVQAAALHLGRDHPLGARRQLTEALRLTAQQGVLRPLIHAPTLVVDLLGSDPQFHGGEHAELITTVLGLRPSHHPDALPLTPRELEVLTMLPTLGSLPPSLASLGSSLFAGLMGAILQPTVMATFMAWPCCRTCSPPGTVSSSR